ncbi:zinc finger protein 91-like [Littorina saxatilis]|uniref:zinc finger protein 91-like n=1 Tax=Littorina saxatilis TaxID=31220 RepID=UPI0038B5B112
MTDGDIPRVMLRQPELHNLYRPDGNYTFEIPLPQTFMAVASAGQVQVLQNPGTVTFLPHAPVSLTEIGHFVPPLPVSDSTELTNVHDFFCTQPSVSAMGLDDKVVTICVEPPPQLNVSPLACHPQDNLTYTTSQLTPPPLPRTPHNRSSNKGDNEDSKGEKPVFLCDQCPATFKRSSNFKIHEQRHLGNKPFACSQCSAAFVEEKNLKRHMVAHRTDRPHVCQECGVAFVESGNLTRHMLTHAGSKDFVCHACGAGFSKSHHLRDHLASHQGVSRCGSRELTCEECHNVFNNPFQLRKHFKNAHSGGTGRPYICSECGAVFGWWNIYRRHLLTHKGEKPFVCEKCDEGFTDNLALRQHKRTHARDKTNACGICDAAFDRPSHLVRHMRMHTGEKPNVCAECGAAFLERNKLMRHMRIHDGAGCVVCEQCGAKFSQVRHLTHHMRSHGDVPASAIKEEKRDRDDEICSKQEAEENSEPADVPTVHSWGHKRKARRTKTADDSFSEKKSTRSGRRSSVENTGNIPLLKKSGKKSAKRETENDYAHSKAKSKMHTRKIVAEQEQKSRKRRREKHEPCQDSYNSESPPERRREKHEPCQDSYNSESPPERRREKHEPCQDSYNSESPPERRREKHEPCQDSYNSESPPERRREKHEPCQDSYNSESPPERRRSKRSTVKQAQSEHKHKTTDSGQNKDDRKPSSAQTAVHGSQEHRRKGSKKTRQGRKHRRKETHTSDNEDDTDDHAAVKCELNDSVTERGQPLPGGGTMNANEDDTDDHAAVKCELNDSVTERGQPLPGGGTMNANQGENRDKTGGEGGAFQFYANHGDDKALDQRKPGSGASHEYSVEEDAKPISYSGDAEPMGDHEGHQCKDNNTTAQGKSDTQSLVPPRLLGLCDPQTKLLEYQTKHLQSEVQIFGEGKTELLGRDTTGTTARETTEWMVVAEVSGARVAGDREVNYTTACAGDNDGARHAGDVADNLKEESVQGLTWCSRDNDSLPSSQAADTSTSESCPIPPLYQHSHTVSPAVQLVNGTMLQAPGVAPHSERLQYGGKVEETDDAGFVLYGCPQCSAVFNSAFSLKLHKRVHTTRTAVCLRCGDIFPSSLGLAQHRQVCVGFLPQQASTDFAGRSGGGRPHGCNLCGTSFVHLNKLKLHMQLHSNSRKFACNECGASFDKSTDLGAHVRTHTGDRPFVCNVCGASYTQSSTLSVHMRTHSGHKPHVCKVCSAAFPRYGRLKVHMRCHSGEKPCVCKLCGAAFKWSQSLLRHMTVQHGSAPYRCKQCGETFHREKLYKAHLQVHSGERPHTCPHCNKAFKKQVQLRRHCRVHTGDWPFLCEECGAGFGSAASLKIHTRCHTGEKPFVCEECGRAFRISSHLTRHMKSHTDHPIFVKRDSAAVGVNAM